jgi:hypothetical protein
LKLRKNATLAEVAARASEQLDRSGIPVAVVGGSAITLYAPEVYASKDIDFAAIRGTNRRAFAAAVAPIGFTARGRDFVHKDTEYTLDLVADTPYVDQRPITRFAMIETPFGAVRVYKFEDAIADRIAAFLHWGDSQSLEVAESAVEARRKDVRWSSLEKALRQLDSSSPEAARRLEIATNRLRARHTVAKRRGK